MSELTNEFNACVEFLREHQVAVGATILTDVDGTLTRPGIAGLDNFLATVHEWGAENEGAEKRNIVVMSGNDAHSARQHGLELVAAFGETFEVDHFVNKPFSRTAFDKQDVQMFFDDDEDMRDVVSLSLQIPKQNVFDPQDEGSELATFLANWMKLDEDSKKQALDEGWGANSANGAPDIGGLDPS